MSVLTKETSGSFSGEKPQATRGRPKMADDKKLKPRTVNLPQSTIEALEQAYPDAAFSEAIRIAVTDHLNRTKNQTPAERAAHQALAAALKTMENSSDGQTEGSGPT